MRARDFEVTPLPAVSIGCEGCEKATTHRRVNVRPICWSTGSAPWAVVVGTCEECGRTVGFEVPLSQAGPWPGFAVEFDGD